MPPKPRKFELVLVTLLVGSLALNAALAIRLHAQNRRLATARAVSKLTAGEVVPPLVASDLNGQIKTISNWGENGTVLYVFSPSCGWCKKNLENQKALAAAAKRKGFRFLAVSLKEEGVREYIAAHDLDTTNTVLVSADSRSKYRLGLTPQTIVISPGGTVVENWFGAYTSDVRSRVEAFFETSLPGIPAVGAVVTPQ